MRRIIGKVLLDTLFYLSNRAGAIISLIGRMGFHPLCRKLSCVVQGLREWRNGIRQRHASSAAEGLGSTYDKRKWMKAYYENPNKATAGYSKRDMHKA